MKKSIASATKYLILIVLLLSLVGKSSTTARNTSTSEKNLANIHSTTGEFSEYGPFKESANISTIVGGSSGNINKGNFYFLKPKKATNRGLWINVELVNKDQMNEAFTSLIEKFVVYQYNPDNHDDNDYENNEKWKRINEKDSSYLTLSKGHVEIDIKSKNVDSRKPLALVVKSGSFYAKESLRRYPIPIHFVELEGLDN